MHSLPSAPPHMQSHKSCTKNGEEWKERERNFLPDPRRGEKESLELDTIPPLTLQLEAQPIITNIRYFFLTFQQRFSLKPIL
jgi:hypothetical protein